jgi:hypothetical protein
LSKSPLTSFFFHAHIFFAFFAILFSPTYTVFKFEEI